MTTIAYCLVILVCIAMSGQLGVIVGRMRERGDCRRRLREQYSHLTARKIEEVGAAHRRGKIDGYELQASRTARAQHSN